MKQVELMGRHICRLLDIDPGVYPMLFCKLLHYPTLYQQSQSEETCCKVPTVVCGDHSDYGLLTFLTATEGGLEILNSKDEWVPVPPRDDAFIVNFGDFCQKHFFKKCKSKATLLKKCKSKPTDKFLYFATFIFPDHGHNL